MIGKNTSESNSPGPIKNGYGNKWPIFDCKEEDIGEYKEQEAEINAQEDR